MSENITERHTARQKGKVGKNALSKRHIVGNRTWLVKDERLGWFVIGQRPFPHEDDLDVRYPELCLVNDQCWEPISAGGERHPPRPLPRPAMLNPLIKNNIDNQGNQKRDDKMPGGVVRFLWHDGARTR